MSDSTMSATSRSTFRIDSIAAGGDGVGRVDGLVTFAARTAPGDLVAATVTSTGRLGRATEVEIVEPSPLRVPPPCPHYVVDHCGGCQIQHLAYPAQLDAKHQLITDALTRIGGVDASVDAVIPSADQWRYRRKLTLALRKRDGDWFAGLHPYDAPGRIFRLRDCPITEERVIAGWRRILAARRFFPVSGALRGAVRALDDGVAFTLEGGRKWGDAPSFFAAVPEIVALWWVPENGRRRLIADRRADAVPGASFAQVNPRVAEALRADVVERVLRHAPETMIDAYAGIGETALALAMRGVRATAIEVDAEAVEYAGMDAHPGMQVLRGTVEARLRDALPTDVIVLNPPRAGLHADVTRMLDDRDGAARAVRAMIYVSCDPATLARDLRRLSRWRAVTLTPYDMFPQTAHVETVCELVPRD